MVVEGWAEYITDHFMPGYRVTLLQRLPALSHFLVLLGLAVACMPLFLLLMPYGEASRTEARLLIAYVQVHRLCDHHRESLEASAAEAPTAPDAVAGSTINLSQRDPWGQHYRLVSLGGRDAGQIRVYSSGPNLHSPLSGMDADDIDSGMPVSPLARYTAVVS